MQVRGCEYGYVLLALAYWVYIADGHRRGSQQTETINYPSPSPPIRYSRQADASNIHGFVPLLMPVVRPKNPSGRITVSDFHPLMVNNPPQVFEVTTRIYEPDITERSVVNLQDDEDFASALFPYQPLADIADDIPGVVYTVENGTYWEKAHETFGAFSVGSSFKQTDEFSEKTPNNTVSDSPVPVRNPALSEDKIANFSSLMLKTTGKIVPAAKPRYFLYTRENRDTPKELLEGQSEQLSSVNASLDMKIIIHGYMDGVNITNWQKAMMKELLDEGNYNVILMDWSPSAEISFFESVLAVPPTGLMLARMMSYVMNFTNFKLENLHMIGHGLGAHVAGVTGHLLPGVGRISALDPTGPLVEGYPEELRLNRGDAKFIDAIHTDGGQSASEGIGTLKNCADVDFYVNGGAHQENCRSSLIGRLGNYTVGEGLLRTAFCDHFLAVSMYLDSIRRKDPPCIGFKCDNYDDFQQGRCADCGDGADCAVLGYRAASYVPFNNRHNGTAKFYLKTVAMDSPFCAYNYGVQMQLGQSSRNSAAGVLLRGKVHLKLRSKTDEVEMEFDKRHDGFEPGASYTRVLSSPTPIGHMDIIMATWNPIRDRLGARRLPLTSLRVFPMSVPEISERQAQSSKACSSCRGGISPGATTVFYTQACTNADIE